MTKNVVEIFVDTLVQAGVTHVYGVVGDSLNGTGTGWIPGWHCNEGEGKE
jgi:hypothetical protein